jgi:ribonuclease Z
LLEPISTDKIKELHLVAAEGECFLSASRMDTFARIITTPTADTVGTTVVLQAPNKNYVFGSLAEGTQRAFSDMGQRVLKSQDFFISGKLEWANVGGLIGMTLTLADVTSVSYESALENYRKKTKGVPEPTRPKLNIYGPPNLKHLLATCRRFIFRKGLPITATEYKAVSPAKNNDGSIPPTWKDENIQVWALSVVPSQVISDAESDALLDSKSDFFDSKLNNFNDNQAPETESTEEREERYNRIRTAVLAHMFDSNWSFDTLVEQHISQVQMPTAMFVRSPKTNRLDSYRGPMPGGQEPLPDIKVLTRTPWPGATVLDLPPTRPAPEAVSYITRTHAVRGKFDAKRAKELGIAGGPKCSKLTKGISVENDKGETITPDMVVAPDRPGQGLAFLHVPSLEYLDPLMSREELFSKDVMVGVQVCIWSLGPGVSGHASFQQAIEKLSGVQHVVASADDAPNRLSFLSVAAQTIRLGQIDPERYQVPFHDNNTIPQESLYKSVPETGQRPTNVLVADRGLSFRIMPKYEMKRDPVRPLLDIPFIQTQTGSDILKLAEAAHQSIEDDRNTLYAWRKLLARPDTEVITLGTGSALPSKYRNVSATLVRIPGIGNYLLDCGEGTLGQLQRVFGPDQLVEVLRNLRMIWISHLHADHHLGTTSVIKAWYAVVHNSVPASQPPNMSSISATAQTYGLAVISHDGMLKWLNEFSSVDDFGYSRIIPLQLQPVSPGESSGSKLQLWPHPTREQSPGEHTLRKQDYNTVLGISDIEACKVSHCYGAMAVSLTFLPEQDADANIKPLKVSYSGDCRPSAHFAKIGKDTTVLIHEATFDDELQADARAKKHSTTSEALGIGAKMDAKAVVLTHFSQRYQKIPVLQTIRDGEEEDKLLDGEAVEDVSEEQDKAETDEQDVDMVNADTDTGNSDIRAALPSDQPAELPRQESYEKVIKVRNQDMKVAVAFDYMRVKIGDIAQMERFSPALNKLLVKEEEEKGDGEDVGDGDEDGGGKGEGKGKGKTKAGGNGKRKSEDEGEGVKKKNSKRNN